MHEADIFGEAIFERVAQMALGTPIDRTRSGCCARAASGQATAALWFVNRAARADHERDSPPNPCRWSIP